MGLLWITETYPPNKGGMAQSCDRIVFHLRAAGLSIDVIHLTRKTRVSGSKRHGRDLQLPMGDDPSHALAALWSEIQHSSRRYEGVIAFGATYGLTAAINFSTWLGIPLYVFIRGNDFDTSVFDPRKRALLADACERATHVFCVSSDKQARIAAQFPRVPCTWIPSGIDTDWQALPSERASADTIRSKLPADRIVLGVLGQLKAKKGFPLLIEAIERGGLSDDVALITVGDHEGSMLESMSTTSLAWLHNDWVPRDALPAWYLACDALVIPSYYDGLPNVLLEAGSLGIPVVGADCGGIADVISDGETGLTFVPGRSKSLRDALIRLIDLTRAEREHLGEALSRRVLSEFSANRECQRYLGVFGDDSHTSLSQTT
jgi:glycogen synthase